MFLLQCGVMEAHKPHELEEKVQFFPFAINYVMKLKNKIPFLDKLI
jgi:hypothetical protein